LFCDHTDALFSGKWKSVFTSADQFFSGLASADLALKANIMGCPVEEEQCWNLVDQPSCEPCGVGGRCDCHWSYYDQMNPDSGGYCEDNDPGDSQSICPTEEVRLWHQMLSATLLPQYPSWKSIAGLSATPIDA
jgi:hypothetical protein